MRRPLRARLRSLPGQGARSLVASGEADQADFWVFVGYAGWAPKQLEGVRMQAL